MQEAKHQRTVKVGLSCAQKGRGNEESSMPSKVAISADKVVSEADTCPDCGEDALRYESLLQHGGMFDITSGLACNACTWSQCHSERCPDCGVSTLVGQPSGDRARKTCAHCGWTGSLHDISIH